MPRGTGFGGRCRDGRFTDTNTYQRRVNQRMLVSATFVCRWLLLIGEGYNRPCCMPSGTSATFAFVGVFTLTEYDALINNHNHKPLAPTTTSTSSSSIRCQFLIQWINLFLHPHKRLPHKLIMHHNQRQSCIFVQVLHRCLFVQFIQLQYEFIHMSL